MKLQIDRIYDFFGFENEAKSLKKLKKSLKAFWSQIKKLQFSSFITF